MNRSSSAVLFPAAIPFTRQPHHTDASERGRLLSLELRSTRGAIDHGTRTVLNCPLFAAAGLAVVRPLFADPTAAL